jgi:hypothetical protein
VIAFNGGNGVNVPHISDRVTILSNAIFSNGGLGINLANNDVTPNDECDVDPSSDRLQNFPVLTGAISAGPQTVVHGRLNSEPNIAYQLQFFASSVADPSGFGEGERFLGAATATTDAACNATFVVRFPIALASGRVVTATATHTQRNSTSEFSNAVPVRRPREETRLLIDQVKELVEQRRLPRVAGFVLNLKLTFAIVAMDRERFQIASVLLSDFIRTVNVLVRTGNLAADDGQALIDSTNTILDLLET